MEQGGAIVGVLAGRPLRVLSLSTLYPGAGMPGNFGQFVVSQFAALAARGDIALSVVAPLSGWRYGAGAATDLPGPTPPYPLYRPRYWRVPKVGTRWDPSAIARAVLPLARRLHAQAPFDLVDAQFFYPDGPAAARIAGTLGLPLIIKARGSDIHRFGTVPAARRQMLAAARQAATLLAVSSALRQDMIALGMPAEKIAVHRTGLDHARFRLRPRKAALAQVAQLVPSGAGPLLVSVGNLVPLKRHDRAIELLVHLPDARLAIAGEGPERARLTALATRLGLAGRVRLCGALPQDRLAALLCAADLLVHPSEREGLANVWVEALACGTPLLLAEAGAAREVVHDGAAGLVADWNDPAALTAAARSLLDRPSDRKAVAASVAQFSWERNAAELADHYRTSTRNQS